MQVSTDKQTVEAIVKLQIFSIFDAKAAAFFTPFFLPTEGMAVRQFQDMVNDNESHLSKHPEDYTLFHLGEFLDGDGLLAAEKPPVALVNGAACVESTIEPVPFEPTANTQGAH